VENHRLEHLRRGDHGLPALQRPRDDPLLQERNERRADLDAEVAARNHDRVGLDEHVVECVDRLRLLDLRDHVRMRARLLDQRLQVPHVGGGTHERERDVVHAEIERELEVVDVLARQRGDRNRDARQVHALVRGHGPADEDAAARTAALDLLDAQPDVAVVDQHLVPGSQHLGDDGRGDRQLAVLGWNAVGADDRDLRAPLEIDRSGELAHADLRPLEVPDDRDRLPGPFLRLADPARGGRVVVVRPVREVQPCRVHPGRDQRVDLLDGGRRRSDRRHDLRAARRRFRHGLRVAPQLPGAATFLIRECFGSQPARELDDARRVRDVEERQRNAPTELPRKTASRSAPRRRSTSASARMFVNA
jgi:hypothetical protein